MNGELGTIIIQGGPHAKSQKPRHPRYIFDRICQIHDEILINDPEYKELGKIPSELFHRLFAKLPAEDREILDQYDSESLKPRSRQDEILYSRRLKDGIFLCRWIERIGRGEEKDIL